MNSYSPTRLKDVNKGRRIKSSLERAIHHYNNRDPRLWDELYEANLEGIKFKTFSLPSDFVPLKALIRDSDFTIAIKPRSWPSGNNY